MSIKKYSEFISLHEQKTRTIGIRSIDEEDKNDSKEYPKSNHLHLDMYEGEERHIIKGIRHSSKNADHVFNKVVDHVSKKGKFHPDVTSEVLGQPHHITAAHDPEDSHKMHPIVHNNVSDFIKHTSKDNIGIVKYGTQGDD